MTTINVNNVYPISVIPKRCRKPRQKFIADQFQVTIREADPKTIILLAEWNEPLQYENQSYRKKLYRYNGELYTQAIKNQPAGKNNTIYELQDFLDNAQRENLLDSHFNSPFHSHPLAIYRFAQQDFHKLLRHENLSEENYRDVLFSGRDEVQEKMQSAADNYLIFDGQLLEVEAESAITIQQSGYGFVSVSVGRESYSPSRIPNFRFDMIESAEKEAIKLAEAVDNKQVYGFSMVEEVKNKFKELDIKTYA
ncbi:hypothetical protein QX249_10470 [Vibrio parahaemolyticus]|uniref:Uncharacterized protein n=1 Tax=Vibrio parahaemolyticus TaxID=670 RepID=A0AAW8Q0H9_VIBPH|nr:hypothetical protein [Vibrio parahaemolyticus]MDS1821084.1 hypothetical protein [Vibrio parahaemolyticus]